METATATPDAKSVGLVPSLTETTCSLTLQKSFNNWFSHCNEIRVLDQWRERVQNTIVVVAKKKQVANPNQRVCVKTRQNLYINSNGFSGPFYAWALLQPSFFFHNLFLSALI